MVILFESPGNFIVGKSTFRMLISKRSRGVITLTDQTLSFLSDLDKIMYQIKIKDIKNFFLRDKINLRFIELSDIHENEYSFHAMIKKNESYSTSKFETGDLFRHLTRTILKRDKPIFFEAKGGFWIGTPNVDNWKNNMRKGIIILTEDYLSFKAFESSEVNWIKILDVEMITPHQQDSIDFVKISMPNNNKFTVVPLKKKIGRYVSDQMKSKKLLELLNQVKVYKRSELLKVEIEEKKRVDQIKEMLRVSSKLKLDMMRVALEMDEKSFSTRVFEWAKKFNFVIDGDYLIVDSAHIDEFLENLDEIQGLNNKFLCKYCQKKIDPDSIKCPYCGVKID
jgi:hypothetical protein